MVPASSDIDYSVSLYNKTDMPFSFGECPNYKEGINVGGDHSDASYELNCQGSSIDPKESVTFDMQVRSPDSTGPAKLGWFMDQGPSEVASLFVG